MKPVDVRHVGGELSPRFGIIARGAARDRAALEVAGRGRPDRHPVSDRGRNVDSRSAKTLLG